MVLLCSPVFVPQMTGGTLPPGPVSVKVSVRHSVLYLVGENLLSFLLTNEIFDWRKLKKKFVGLPHFIFFIFVHHSNFPSSIWRDSNPQPLDRESFVPTIRPRLLALEKICLVFCWQTKINTCSILLAIFFDEWRVTINN